jgi:hypothetical protein
MYKISETTVDADGAYIRYAGKNYYGCGKHYGAMMRDIFRADSGPLMIERLRKSIGHREEDAN